MNSLKSKILETVKHNKIRMIPKWKFVLYSSLGIIGILFTFFVMVFVMSLMLFVLSRYGYLDMPYFGIMQSIHALRAIPTVLLLFTIVLLIIIEVISRAYTFTFRRPLAVTLLAITSLATVSSYLVSQTTIHEYVRDYMKSHHHDMFFNMYERPPLRTDANGMDVLRGEVVLTSATSATLVLFNGETIVVYATTTQGTTTMPKFPNIGDDVVMLGTFVGKQFEVMRFHPAHHGPFGRPMKRNHDMSTMHMMNVK